jgi:uronate dehydrogenase
MQPVTRIPQKPVLLTGASGGLGQVIARHLASLGWTLRLTDRVPFPSETPPGATFSSADLEDLDAVLHLAEGCGTILHFGGISVEHPFETVIGPNIRGLYHAYEAARHEGARMVFASSNHTIGFHDRAVAIDDDSYLRPDGYYGLSKAYGELMGRLYWDKHGVESVFLRIGSCRTEPDDARMLSTWLSHRDMATLAERSVMTPSLGEAGCVVVWGVSKNTPMTWWRKDGRDIIGWEPVDSADSYTDGLVGKTSDPVSERYQGGGYCSMGYSRTVPSSTNMFADRTPKRTV